MNMRIPEAKFFDTNPLLLRAEHQVMGSIDPMDQGLLWALENAEYNENGALRNIGYVRELFAQTARQIFSTGVDPQNRLEEFLKQNPDVMAEAA